MPRGLEPYDSAFYAAQAARSFQAANIVLPAVIRLLDEGGVPVRSVVDVGAGVGPWLKAAQGLGISDVLAVEGAWVRGVEALVAEDCYRYADVGKQLSIGRKFDLALCLEVAEHLPATDAATLVANLCSHSDVVLFSAAIPHQGGVQHVNERWPSYWANHFEEKGFSVFDVLRWLLWHDDRVPYWYRQNAFLYIHRQRADFCSHYLSRLPYGRFMPSPPCAVVHPLKYASVIEDSQCLPASVLLRALPRALWRAMRWHLKRFIGLP
jgi:hypothetical protein